MRAFARQMTERMKAVAATGAVAAFWLAVWVLVAGLVAQPLILPGPGAVVVALLRLVCDAGTWAILAGSGVRILGGLALAAVCGGLLAGISSRSRAFARLVAPALSFVKATPVACVVVLLLIWLGSARVSIAAVFLMALPGVYFSLVEGLTQADKPLEQMSRVPRPCCACWCRGSMCMLVWPSSRAGSAVASRLPEPCCVRAAQ